MLVQGGMIFAAASVPPCQIKLRFKAGPFLGFELSLIRTEVVQFGLGEKRPLNNLKGFPAFTLRPSVKHSQPFLMLDLREIGCGGGFFDSWHHVVHHVKIKTKIKRKVNTQSLKVTHREQSSPMVKEGEGFRASFTTAVRSPASCRWYSASACSALICASISSPRLLISLSMSSIWARSSASVVGIAAQLPLKP